MKHKAREIELYDASGRMLFRGRAEEMPLPQDWIVRLSVRFFNDPDPCFIHQGAVRARVAMEIEQALAGAPAEHAPEYLRAMGAEKCAWAEGNGK